MTKPSIVRGIGVFSAGGVLLSLVSGAAAQSCPDHGVPQVVAGATFPNWQERATLVLTNGCRIAPADFRNFYLSSSPGILQPTSYPSVPPLQWVVALNRSSRFHSNEMATVPGCVFQHNSCDNTDWSARISSYYPSWTALGENIAAGQGDPLGAMTAWLLDGSAASPAADGSGADGHRRNIMGSSFTQLGCGYAAGGPYGKYWTQDFGRPSGSTTICSPIAAGSHIKQGTSINFLVTYYSSTNVAPQSANIVLAGTSVPLSLHLGTAARGTYRLSTPAGAACRSYHFEIRDSAGTLWRYPASGELRTFGEGSCAEDYTAASTPPACRVDFDNSGTVGINDVFAFLNAWTIGDARADFNASGSLTTQDIFDFLNAWFVGC